MEKKMKKISDFTLVRCHLRTAMFTFTMLYVITAMSSVPIFISYSYIFILQIQVLHNQTLHKVSCCNPEKTNKMRERERENHTKNKIKTNQNKTAYLKSLLIAVLHPVYI